MERHRERLAWCLGFGVAVAHHKDLEFFSTSNEKSLKVKAGERPGLLYGAWLQEEQNNKQEKQVEAVGVQEVRSYNSWGTLFHTLKDQPIMENKHYFV